MFRLNHTCFVESAIAIKLDDADAEVGQQQIQGLFKDFIQFWPNSRTFKALKMKQFFLRIFKEFQGTLCKVDITSFILGLEGNYKIRMSFLPTCINVPNFILGPKPNILSLR